MTVFIDGKKPNEMSLAGVSLADVLCFACRDEIDEALDVMRMRRLEPILASEGTGTRFESHEEFEYMSVRIPDFDDVFEAPSRADIFLFENKLLLIHDEIPPIAAFINSIEYSQRPLPPEEALYLFFSKLLEQDERMLEDIEDEIVELEDDIAADESEDYVRIISNLRRRLLALKRYYQGLFEMFEDLEENPNNLISRDRLHMFRLHTNRADRLADMVLHLRDYVTQVREAYQTQMDISLNQTMRLFTVITAVFLPLTLITGWYGMNLEMPEYDIPFFYPVLIGVCLLIAAGCLYYFKRKKWF